MPEEIIETTLGDIRYVKPPGQKPPPGGKEPPDGGEPREGPDEITVPSYETDTEDWDDQEDSEGGGMPDRTKKPPPKGRKGQGDEKGEGEKSDFEKDLEKVAEDYAESPSADIDELKKKTMGEGDEKEEEKPKGGLRGPGDDEEEGGEPGGSGENGSPINSKFRQTKSDARIDEMLNPTERTKAILNKKAQDTIHDIMTDHKLQPGELNSDAARGGRTGPAGTGKGISFLKEYQTMGYAPLQTGLWRSAVKDFFESVPDLVEQQSWVHTNLRTAGIENQIYGMTGYNSRMPHPNALVPRQTKVRMLCFVDVSGSVFSERIQAEFAAILRAVPEDKIEITIFTFDVEIKGGPFTPKNYKPHKGGGGTDPWRDIAGILKLPLYRNPDGVCMLTDGQFATPPAGLITKPQEWCFVLTSICETSAIPRGCRIVETFVDDPEWAKKERDPNSEVMRSAYNKT